MTRRMRVFKRWMKANNLTYSDAVELIDSPSNGISVIALRDLVEGEEVATIPKRACLTIKNSAARRMILESELSGHLGLSVAVMYERSLGVSSPWYGYLQILPEMECSPLVWSSDEVDTLLRGTELQKVVKEDKKLVREDWREFILPLIESGNWGLDPKAFSVDQYFYAKTLVASRSFEIDEYHGYGMVPFADLFNHKTGLENVHFTAMSNSSSSSDDEMSDAKLLEYNNDYYNDHDDDDDGRGGGGGDGDGGGDDDGDDDDESNHHKDDDDADENAGDDDETMKMFVVRSVQAGHEVFNTYGSMGNAALLLRYGFTEIDNPFDIVNLDLSLVLRWCSSSLSSRHIRSRLSLWRRLGLSGCNSQDSEYFEISSNGEPQTELLILMFIIFLPEEGYEKMNQAAKWKKDDSVARFLTEEICKSLLGLADAREALYGGGSVEEDLEMLSRCCRERERKLHDSLILRLAERRVLKRFRAYISKGKSRAKREKEMKVQFGSC